MPLEFPDTKKFKKRMEKALSQDPDLQLLSVLQRSRCEDIEEVLTAIDEIPKVFSERGGKLLNNTVSFLYDGIVSYQGSTAMPFARLLEDFAEFGKKIRSQVYDEYAWKDTITREKLGVYDGIFKILRKSDNEIDVFTTNYDQVMEHYMDHAYNKLFCVNGFDSNGDSDMQHFKPELFSIERPGRTNAYVKCFLHKLHGSLDWVLDGGTICRRQVEKQTKTNFVIYPTLTSKKDSYADEPYATMWKELELRMKETDFLIVVGYSFRDEEINKRFKDFLNHKGKLLVISPSAVDDISNKLGDVSITDLHVEDVNGKNELDELTKSTHSGTGSGYPENIFKEDLRQSFGKLFGDYDKSNVYTLPIKLEDVDESMLRVMAGIFYLRGDWSGGSDVWCIPEDDTCNACGHVLD